MSRAPELLQFDVHAVSAEVAYLLPGESAFAVSGTCVATHGDGHAWIATGGAAKARILATTGGGESWSSHDTPLPQGTPASGLFTVAFRDRRHGIIAGGGLEAPDVPSDNLAVSHDGGRTWKPMAPPWVLARTGASEYLRVPDTALSMLPRGIHAVSRRNSPVTRAGKQRLQSTASGRNTPATETRSRSLSSSTTWHS